MDNKKLVSTAKTLDTVAKIADGFLRAFVIVFLVFALLVLIFGSRMIAGDSITLELDFVRLRLDGALQEFTGTVKFYIIASLVSAAVFCFAAHRAVVLLRQIFAPMKDERPFDGSIPANLRKIAWVVLTGGALIQVFGIIERLLLMKAHPLEQMFSSAAISEIEYLFHFGLDFVLLAGALLLLSYIFSYGQFLQQESDETL